MFVAEKLLVPKIDTAGKRVSHIMAASPQWRDNGNAHAAQITFTDIDIMKPD